MFSSVNITSQGVNGNIDCSLSSYVVRRLPCCSLSWGIDVNLPMQYWAIEEEVWQYNDAGRTVGYQTRTRRESTTDD